MGLRRRRRRRRPSSWQVRGRDSVWPPTSLLLQDEAMGCALSVTFHLPPLCNADLAQLPRLLADDGMYAVKKVLVQSEEQLALVRAEVAAMRRFAHPNILPLLDHSIIPVKPKNPGAGGPSQEAYLLFPVHRGGTLTERLERMRRPRGSASGRDHEHFPALTVLQIFRQICAGLEHMHGAAPPHAHNDVKPGNLLLSEAAASGGAADGTSLVAVLMDFGSCTPAVRRVTGRNEALALQEWAASHCTAPYRAPELWDCPSHAEFDARNDIWSLGCTLFAIMYGQSPFEYAVGEAGGSLQLAVMNAAVKWPPPPDPPYPLAFHQLVTWMLQPQQSIRPAISDVVLHTERLLAKLPPTCQPLLNGGMATNSRT
eukprot:SM000164S02281  [mRNA]  locus=s164:237246:239577:- [translate_table: standard]